MHQCNFVCGRGRSGVGPGRRCAAGIALLMRRAWRVVTLIVGALPSCLPDKLANTWVPASCCRRLHRADLRGRRVPAPPAIQGPAEAAHRGNQAGGAGGGSQEPLWRRRSCCRLPLKAAQPHTLICLCGFAGQLCNRRRWCSSCTTTTSADCKPAVGPATQQALLAWLRMLSRGLRTLSWSTRMLLAAPTSDAWLLCCAGACLGWTSASLCSRCDG